MIPYMGCSVVVIQNSIKKFESTRRQTDLVAHVIIKFKNKEVACLNSCLSFYRPIHFIIAFTAVSPFRYLLLEAGL